MDWFLFDNGLRHERVNSVVRFGLASGADLRQPVIEVM